MFHLLGSLLKLFFLAGLLVTNIIGYHYYFAPIAKENTSFIPSNSVLQFTINLKKISGTIIEEIVFHPEQFDKEIVSGKEREMFVSNLDFGFNPVGLLSVFVFPFQSKLVPGLSYNLKNRSIAIESLEHKKMEKKVIDGIHIYFNHDYAFFIFEKSANLLKGDFSDSEIDDLSGIFLKNSALELDFTEHDFTFHSQKGALTNTPFEALFRLMPEFFHGQILYGDFKSGEILLNGFLQLENIKDWNDKLSFDKPNIKFANELILGCSGNYFQKPIYRYINQIAKADDSIGNYAFSELDVNGLALELNKFSFPIEFSNMTDFIDLQKFNPSYSSNFIFEINSIPNDLNKYQTPFTLKNDNDLNRKLYAKFIKGDSKKNLAYFYFNPIQLIENSDLNILFQSVIEPFLIFKDVFLYAEKYENGKFYFSGKMTMQNQEVHSLVTMRELFKSLTSIL